MNAAEEIQEQTRLLASLRGQAMLIVSGYGREGAYLDVIARRVYGVEQYHKCSIEQLRDMLTRLRNRAQAEPVTEKGRP